MAAGPAPSCPTAWLTGYLGHLQEKQYLGATVLPEGEKPRKKLKRSHNGKGIRGGQRHCKPSYEEGNTSQDNSRGVASRHRNQPSNVPFHAEERDHPHCPSLLIHHVNRMAHAFKHPARKKREMMLTHLRAPGAFRDTTGRLLHKSQGTVRRTDHFRHAYFSSLWCLSYFWERQFFLTSDGFDFNFTNLWYSVVD